MSKETIDLISYRNKKNFNKVVEQFRDSSNEATSVWSDFVLMTEYSPKEAIEKMPEFIERARNACGEGRMAYESYVGGPKTEWTGSILNVLGEVYPFLDKDVRQEGLKKVLNFLDGLNYSYAQDQMELVDEPWLAADVFVNRGIYWCGFQENIKLLAENRDWKDFSKHLDQTKSKFLLCFSVVQPKHSSLSVRKGFYEQFPELVDRTLDAVAAINYNYALDVKTRKGILVEDYLSESLVKYDPLFHDKIRGKILEEKWIRLTD